MQRTFKITVVGMGIMGPDIALALVMGGHQVTAFALKQESLDGAKRRITTAISELVNMGGLIAEKAAMIPSRITFTTDWDTAMPEADLVIEAVPEKLEIKKGIFQRCGEICRQDAIIASNTSSISMTEIASEMRYPERAIVTHWFIPAFLMPVVEVVPGKNTSDSTIKATKDFLTQAGKHPVVCRENPGFVHNYIQAAMCRAAVTLVEQGVCTAEDVDAIVGNGFALRLARIGPIRMVDYAGLDTNLALLRYVYAKTGDPAFKAPKLIEEKVARGELGLKTGKGMYDYSEEDVLRIRKLADETIMKVKKALDKS